MDKVNYLINAVFDVIFPPSCISCGKTGTNLCEKCLISAPLALRETESWIIPLYDYRDDRIKKALWLLKYNRRKDFAKIFAEALYGRIIEELADLRVIENFTNPILVPIPLSKNRLKERGFNQSELVCKELVNIGRAGSRSDSDMNLVLDKDVLVKQKDTVRQAHIENRAERLRNLIGSFSVQNTGAISGRNVILIDDITTTGATLGEARKTLKENGARKIIAFTIAH